MRMLFAVAAVVLCCSVKAAEFDLIADGKAVCHIVRNETSPLPVQYAARELASYLARISGGERPGIGGTPVPDRYNIFLGTVADPGLTARATVEPNLLCPGGFAIMARNDGLYIIGGDPLGTLYGAYDILKKCGGIRWLFPGEEGEYFKTKARNTSPAPAIRKSSTSWPGA